MWTWAWGKAGHFYLLQEWTPNTVHVHGFNYEKQYCYYSLGNTDEESQIHDANAWREEPPEQEEEKQDLGHQIHLAYILIICFLAEHNLPFLVADHLLEFCKAMFPDSAIAQGLHMKRTKCTEVAKKVGGIITEDLAS
ncbi:uncharacterized protein [Penaeus vannamei]|uniref:uncharacterized protein n=1 Tax=Penaeus vannamei TaxID=6689 RepID=UPI000F67668E|nr:uncharacterized protein LOC113823378 [Penaeus vannamei]